MHSTTHRTSSASARGGGVDGRKVREIESILREQSEAHERLLGMMAHKREALRRADRDAVMAWCAKENELVGAISELEKRRLSLVAELTLAMDPGAREPMPLRDLAQRLAEPERGRLLALRAALREKIERAQREAGSARRSTERLLAHMQGLIQSVGTMIGGSGTYGPGVGRAEASMNVSTFSTTG